MNVRWLPALIVAAGIMISGCKSEEQCWIDHAASTSFCNDDFYGCWADAENRYEATACYNDTYDTCMDESSLTLWECTGDVTCAETAAVCTDECGDDEACVEACNAEFDTCWGGDSCVGDRFVCDLGCELWDDACLDGCKVDMFVCSGGTSCEEVELTADATTWECEGEGWYDWVCEETCNAFSNFCASQAECKEAIAVGDNCPPDQLLDLDDRDEFLVYIDAMLLCEEDRRICTMCCYDVDYHDEISCSDIDWEAMAEDFPI
jgi:hypothetical protein